MVNVYPRPLHLTGSFASGRGFLLSRTSLQDARANRTELLRHMRSATAEIVIEPGVRGWLVRIHWPRGAPTKLSFSTEQAARNWAKTASSDWIANHPRHGRPQSRLNQGCEREKSNVNVRPCTDVSEHRRTNIAPASASSLKKRSPAPISLPKGGGSKHL